MKGKRKKRGKRPLTYAITDVFESEIRSYVDAVHEKTRQSKGHIVSLLLVDGVRRAIQCYPVNTNNSISGEQR